MPNLHITNPQLLKPYLHEEPPQTIVLEMVIAPSVTLIPEQAIKLKLVRRMEHREHVAIWLAETAGEEVVVKIIMVYDPTLHYEEQNAIDKLRKESDWYNTALRELQGVIVPRFFGLYTGQHKSHQWATIAACMILEYCGETADVLIKSDIYK